MAEQRCPHKFLRSVVACPTCGPLKVRATEPTMHSMPFGTRYNFVDLTGQTIARAKVQGRAPDIGGKTAWWCVCPCGERFALRAQSLRNKHKAGQRALCRKCGRSACLLGTSSPKLKSYPIATEHAVATERVRSVG